MVSWLELYKGSQSELKKEVDVVRAGTEEHRDPTNKWVNLGRAKRRGAAMLMITISTQGRGRTVASSAASATHWLLSPSANYLISLELSPHIYSVGRIKQYLYLITNCCEG